MQQILSNIRIEVNPHLFLKDPESSDLGKRIVHGSIELLHEFGFEDFNFRMLGKHIGSPEASVYRYFENKHKVLLYLTTWYWAMTEYQLMFEIVNVSAPEQRLKKAISLLTSSKKKMESVGHVNLATLHQIVLVESSKAYLTKHVDSENSEGCFAGYKRLVARVADIIIEINPGYKYPHMLVSTMVEGAHLQRFFAEHLPRLTDVVEGEDAITEFAKQTVFSAIGAEL